MLLASGVNRRSLFCYVVSKNKGINKMKNYLFISIVTILLLVIAHKNMVAYSYVKVNHEMTNVCYMDMVNNTDLICD